MPMDVLLSIAACAIGFCASDVMSLNVNAASGAEKTSTEQLDNHCLNMTTNTNTVAIGCKHLPNCRVICQIGSLHYVAVVLATSSLVHMNPMNL